MKLNVQKLAQMAGSMLGIDSGKLNSAIQQASQLTGNAQTKADALNVLKQNGIGNDFLERVQASISRNPMAGRIAGMLGMNVSDVQKGLNELKTGTGSTGSAPAASFPAGMDDRVERMRKRLSGAKK